MGSLKPLMLPGRREGTETLMDVMRWTWSREACVGGSSWGLSSAKLGQGAFPAYRLRSGRLGASPIILQPNARTEFFGKK